MQVKFKLRCRIMSSGKIIDFPPRLKNGWSISEVIGISIINPRGIAAAKKNTTVGQ